MSSEFRTLRNQLRGAAIVLLVLGLLRIVLSGFIFASAPRTGADPLQGLLLGIDVAAGIGMVVAAVFVQRRPQRTAMIVMMCWLLTQLLIALVSPVFFLLSLIGRVFTTVGLSVGVAASRRAESLREELASRSTVPASE